MRDKKIEKLSELVRSAQDTVRESGYATVMLKACGEIGEHYSRAFVVWERACRHLLALAELLGPETVNDCQQFIAASWNPRTNKC